MKQEKSSVPFEQWSKPKKAFAVIGLALGGTVQLVINTAIGYLGYVWFQYYRIEDNHDLAKDITHKSELTADNITSSDTLKIMTYNIGFGAYDREYDFFMDSGDMKDGTHIQGTHSRGRNKSATQTNTDGAVKLVKDNNVDFAIIQEVDTDSTRSYHINQYKAMQGAYENYDSVFASNFHTAYLAYPFTEPMGIANSGLATLSKYKIESAIRRSYPVDTSIYKLFDLDRSFSVSRMKLRNGKELVIGNSHMSAYDEGGKIRAKQLTFLKEFLTEEANKGNYVILGGDFNHDIAKSSGLKEGDENYKGYESYFMTDEVHPNWVAYLSESDLPEGYKIGTSLNAPTCRAAEMPYTRVYNEQGDRTDAPGNKYYLSNYSVVIDGFIYSSNVEKVSVTNIGDSEVEFLYSDHNPVVMEFKLKF